MKLAHLIKLQHEQKKKSLESVIFQSCSVLKDPDQVPQKLVDKLYQNILKSSPRFREKFLGEQSLIYWEDPESDPRI